MRWRLCGYFFTKADKKINALKVILSFAVSKWEAKNHLVPWGGQLSVVPIG